MNHKKTNENPPNGMENRSEIRDQRSDQRSEIRDQKRSENQRMRDRSIERGMHAYYFMILWLRTHQPTQKKTEKKNGFKLRKAKKNKCYGARGALKEIITPHPNKKEILPRLETTSNNKRGTHSGRKRTISVQQKNSRKTAGKQQDNRENHLFNGKKTEFVWFSDSIDWERHARMSFYDFWPTTIKKTGKKGEKTPNPFFKRKDNFMARHPCHATIVGEATQTLKEKMGYSCTTKEFGISLLSTHNKS